MNKKLKIFLQVIIVLAIFYFMFMQVFRNWGSLKEYEWHFNYLYLILSFIVLIGYSFCIVFGWHTILKKLFVKIDFLKTYKIRAITELGRYLPGKIWHLVGRTYYAKTLKISPLRILTSVAIELGVNTIAGLIIFLIALPFFFRAEVIIKILPFAVLIPLGLFMIHPKILNKIINFGLKILKKKRIKLHIRYRDMLLLIILYSFFWLVAGFAFFLLVNSIYSISISNFFVIAGIYAVAWVVGFLSFITPGGIGVREGILAGLLSLYMPFSIAIIISLVARIWTIIAELLFAGASLKIKT